MKKHLNSGDTAVSALRVLFDGRICAADDNGTIKLYELDAEDTVIGFFGGANSLCALQAFPDGTLVSGGNDGLMRLWRRNGGGAYESIDTIDGHAGSVLALQLLSDGRIVSAGSDKRVKIWNKGSFGVYECIQTFEDVTNGIPETMYSGAELNDERGQSIVTSLKSESHLRFCLF